MASDEEVTKLRRRLAELAELAAPRDPDPTAANATVLVKTVTVSVYPAAAANAYGVQMVRPSGNQTEGATVTFTAFGPTFYAMNVGTQVPASGTFHLATLTNGRWTFRY